MNNPGISLMLLRKSIDLTLEFRPDAEQYVRILSENIIGPYISNFLRRDWSDVSLYGVPYDLGSVMHYGSQVSQC